MTDQPIFLKLVGEPSDRTYSAIGRIVVYSSELEDHLTGTLNYLSKSNRTAILTVGYGFANVSRDIRLLVQNFVDEVQQFRILEVLAECQEAYRKRNLIVHGRWIPADVQRFVEIDYEPSEHFVLKGKRGRDSLAATKMTTTDIEAIAEELRLLVATVRVLNDKWLEAIDPMTEEETRTRTL